MGDGTMVEDLDPVDGLRLLGVDKKRMITGGVD